MPAGYVYVLHFDSKLTEHAQHYIGATFSLVDRLTEHANGRGSRLCQVLLAAGIEWRLASLFRVKEIDMFRVERSLKDQANAKRYCSLCTNTTSRPWNALPIDTFLLQQKTDSASLRTTAEAPINITTCEPDDIRLPEQMLALSREANNRKALGFIPIAGSEGMSMLQQEQKILIARRSGVLLGYLAYTTNSKKETAKIQQLVVRDSIRRQHLGTNLVTQLQSKHPNSQLHCHVREDLPAVEFWRSLQWQVESSAPHPTSGQNLIHFQQPKSNLEKEF